MEVRDGHFTLAPRLPPNWRRLAFSVRIRGQRVEVDISP
ncbi:MAG: glycosyl hydrolase family 65 protein [Anaerolineae bacterium]